uniref:Uncharacterized protein n=1 Tax=Culex nigripalpus nucleopolyhedrovirus TaxID=130556 RepID=Q99GR6_NPVCN|nr:unknown [Culex nigripalpus nucleopolyhedrovirus]
MRCSVSLNCCSVAVTRSFNGDRSGKWSSPHSRLAPLTVKIVIAVIIVNIVSIKIKNITRGDDIVRLMAGNRCTVRPTAADRNPPGCPRVTGRQRSPPPGPFVTPNTLRTHRHPYN